MHCQTCGFVNPAASIYCQQCGARLAADAPLSPVRSVVRPTTDASRPASMAPGDTPNGHVESADKRTQQCPSCGALQPVGLRFCGECGQSLHSGERPSVAVPPSNGGSVRPRSTRDAAAPSVSPAAVDPGSAQATMVLIRKDGSDGQAYPIAGPVADLGRDEGDVLLTDDPYMDPRHARLERRQGRWVLRDLDSVNGVYLRIRAPVVLNDGDMILAGQQVLRFEVLPEATPLGPASERGVRVFGSPESPRLARLIQYTTEGVARDVHYLSPGETVLGREQGDFVFTEDPFLSRRHATITMEPEPRRFVLRDLGSSNGTALRFRGERELAEGDHFRVGRHLFRFDLKGTKGS